MHLDFWLRNPPIGNYPFPPVLRSAMAGEMHRYDFIPTGYLVKDFSIAKNMIIIIKERDFGESGSEIKIIDFAGQELGTITI